MKRAVRALASRPRPLVFAGIVVSLALGLALQWPAIAAFDWRLAWIPFLVAVGLFALCPLAGVCSFWLLLRAVVPSVRFLPCASVWARSFAARYVPSGAITVAVRLVERDRLGATRRQVVSATICEQIVAGVAAAAVALAAFAAAGRMPPVTVLAVLAAALAIVATGRTLLRRRLEELDLASRRALLAASTVSVAGWLAAGTAAWLFIRSLSAETQAEFLVVLGGFATAWLAGFIVPFAPSGLGAREAMFVGLLAPAVGAGAATALAVGLRLAGVAADFIIVACIESASALAGRASPARRPTEAVS